MFLTIFKYSNVVKSLVRWNALKYGTFFYYYPLSVQPVFYLTFTSNLPKWHRQQLRPQMSNRCISGLYRLEK